MSRSLDLPKPSVMIFSDASLDQRLGAAGWAAWIRLDGRKAIMRGRYLEGAYRRAAAAETAAMANAVIIAEDLGYLTPGAVVMLQSDCLQLLMDLRMAHPATVDHPAPSGISVNLRRQPRAYAYPKALMKIIEIVKVTGVELQVRHVRGHADGMADSGHHANVKCDALAKKGMRNRRAQILAERTQRDAGAANAET